MTTRFIPASDAAKLVNLYHIARTALADRPYQQQGPYDRMLWAAAEYARGNAAVTATGAYKDLSALLDR